MVACCTYMYSSCDVTGEFRQLDHEDMHMQPKTP